MITRDYKKMITNDYKENYKQNSIIKLSQKKYLEFAWKFDVIDMNLWK